MRALIKTVTFWISHITVAYGLVYWITGSVQAALAVGLLEPTVQAGVYLFHEWLWEGGDKAGQAHKQHGPGSPDAAAPAAA